MFQRFLFPSVPEDLFEKWEEQVALAWFNSDAWSKDQLMTVASRLATGLVRRVVPLLPGLSDPAREACRSSPRIPQAMAAVHAELVSDSSALVAANAVNLALRAIEAGVVESRRPPMPGPAVMMLYAAAVAAVAAAAVDDGWAEQCTLFGIVGQVFCNAARLE
jgi:hypothetical protein